MKPSALTRHKLNAIAQISIARQLFSIAEHDRVGRCNVTKHSKRKRMGTPGAFGGQKNRRGGLKVKAGYVPGDGKGAAMPTNRARIMGHQKYVVYSDGSLRKGAK